MIDVLVVGGGPAGLSAAIALRRLGAGRVVVVEREQELGGIPRHTEHTGFGLRDLHRVLDGPAYARRLIDEADARRRRAPARHVGRGLVGRARRSTLVGPARRRSHREPARAVVLATGTRERPRSARLVPGDRPAGVLTTGALQQLAVAEPTAIGRRAVDRRRRARQLLGRAHPRPRRLPARSPWSPTSPATRPTGRCGPRPPSATACPSSPVSAVARIAGRRRVEAVELTDGRRIECDTVVFTGDWVPENELARRAGLTTVPGSLAPVVDGALRTERPGVFAAGNLLHGAETADVCALDGRHVAAAVAAWLADGRWPAVGRAGRRRVAGALGPPERRPARGRRRRGAATCSGSTASSPERRLAVLQGERVLWTGRSRGALVPNRSIVDPVRLGGSRRPRGRARARHGRRRPLSRPARRALCDAVLATPRAWRNGRRAGFRSRFRKECGFDSHRPHRCTRTPMSNRGFGVCEATLPFAEREASSGPGAVPMRGDFTAR